MTNRMAKRITVLALAFVLLLGMLPTASARAIDCSAKAAVLLDTQSGRFLYEKSAKNPMLIASTTKMMTALVVIKNCKLDAVVTIKKEQTGIEGSSMYLKVDEKLTVRELLYGLLLSSGNDAAEALAVHCAGSIAQFARMMNEEARALGLTNTHFANPHGLNANEHYSCARDLALIAMEGLKNEDFRQIVSTKTINLAGRAMQNHNKLLWNYQGAIGIKTGYTIKAGRCLVSAVERDGRVLVAVTLNDPDDWKDHAAMYDIGFSQYNPRELCRQGDVIGSVSVLSGTARAVLVRAKETVTMTLTDDEMERVALSMETTWYAWAPISAGSAAGKARFLLDGKLLGETILYYDHDVPQYVPPKKSFWKSLTDFGSRISGKAAQ